MNLKFEIKFHIKIFKHNMGQMKLIFLFLILSIKKTYSFTDLNFNVLIKIYSKLVNKNICNLQFKI